MQTLLIKKNNLLKSIKIPSSKSYANRALILSAVSDNSPSIHDLPQATDVSNLIRCLVDVGLLIKQEGQSIQFLNSFPACEKNGDVYLTVGEGGTTARFMAVMLLLGKQRYRLKLGTRLKDRPWNEFIVLARSLGAYAELQDDLLTIKGPATFPSEFKVDCSLTTQFATAFQLIAEKGKTQIITTHMNSSQSYWAMTLELQKQFKQCLNYYVPLDWSSASYPMAYAALNHEIEFPGLKYDGYQADSKFFALLSSFQCVIEKESAIVVKPLIEHREVDLDVSDCLDLVPTLAYFLAHIEGRHSLKGVENLAHKESNRLEEVMLLLKIFHRKTSFDGKVLQIEGKKERLNSHIDLNLPDDHRMVMAGTLFLLHHGGGNISPVDSVNKSFPGFFNIISS